MLALRRMLVLNGGDEFKPGNEPQDRQLVSAALPGPAYVVATAAGRQRPDLAVATARRWFEGLGLSLEELPIYSRRDAGSEELAARAAEGGFFYLTGGDPGLVASTLAGTLVWRTVVDRWAAGAPVAGSSAGAMALCQHTLVMAKWPRHDQRRPVDALGLVPATAVVPHFDTFGHRWTVTSEPSGVVQLGLDERTAAVWDGAAWRAAGAGAVTVIAGGRSRRFEAGQACEGIPAPIEPSPEGAR